MKKVLTLCILTTFVSIGFAGAGIVLQPKAAQAATQARDNAQKQQNKATQQLKSNVKTQTNKVKKSANSACGSGKHLVGYNGTNNPICANNPAKQ